MAKDKKIVEEKTIATEDVKQDEIQQEAPISDRKVILAPLAKYGIVAVIMASIIITTAIMMDKEFNNIDAQVTALDAEIAQRNLELTQSEKAATAAKVAVVEEVTAVEEDTGTTTTEVITAAIIKSGTETVNAEIESAATVNKSKNTEIKQTASTEVITPIATTPVAPVDIVTASKAVVNVKTRIARLHEYLAAQDSKQLKTFKENQARQIKMLRAQLAQQQEQITAIEERNQKSYEMRVTAVKRMQDARDQSLNRI